MYRKLLTLSMVWLMSVLVLMVPRGADAQEKITGPWLWMIAPTEAGQGGANSTDVDSLATASGGAVTEADVAANGADVGDVVGNYAWTLSTIQATGGDNVTDVVQRIGWADGDVNDHSSYALITLESINAQNNVTMRVGSDDAIKVWLNGQVVHTNAINRGSVDFQDNFPVNLIAGDNLLLVKVSEATNSWSMFVGIDANVNAVYKPPTGSTDPSLILWLSFDELNGNRAIDHSPYGNHGTVAGNRQLVAGRFGNALTFNGASDWVEIPHHNSLTVDTSVTVMAWIHKSQSAAPHGSEWQGIIAKNNDFRSYSLYTATGNLVHLSVGENMGAGSATTNRAFALNTWQHVAVQVDNNSVHRYWINGESAGTFQIGNTLPGLRDTASVLVGKTHEDNREFLGMIDEVRVWNRALSEAEIREQMTTGYGRTDPPVTGVYMYWADTGANKIQRASLDGSNLQDLVPAGSGRPVGIALDIAGGKMYWTDRNKADETDPTGRSSIQRANLDGTNIETLVLGGNSVKEYISLDISNGKMYWSEWTHSAIGGSGRIRRANLDGSNIEDIVPRVDGIRGMTLDISEEKIYWGHLTKLRCANLDGSNIQDVLTVDDPHGIALDIAGGKIYWANPNQTAQRPGRIRRANLDGSNIEDLVVGLGNPYGITLDISNDKMYWTDPGRNKIQRANIDGTNIEDIVTGLRSPIGIALGIPQPPPSDGLRFRPSDINIADQTFTVGTDVSLNLPIAIGGTKPYAYTLTPDPPAGLQFDAIDRLIGGTPTAPMQTTPYTYTATDVNGRTVSLAFTITVTDASALENGLFAEVYRPGNTLTELPDFQTLTPVRSFTITNFDIPLRPCAQGFPGLGIDIIDNFAIRFHGQLNIATPGTYNFAIDVDDGSRLYINGSLIIDHDGLATLARGNPGRGSVTLTAGLHDVEVQYFQGPCSHIGLQWFWQPPGGTEAIVPADVLYLPATLPGSRISFSPSPIVNQTFTVGTAVNLTLPTATGGSAPYTYTLFPIPNGLNFDAATQRLTGTPTTVGTTQTTYAATDVTGVSAALIFTITVESLNLDVNGDGKVDVLDLVWVAISYGMRGPNLPADVNADAVVNVTDLIAVAEGIDAGTVLPTKIAEEVLFAAEAAAAELEGGPGAPRIGFSRRSDVTAYGNVAAALADARALVSGDVRLGKWLPLLEELLQKLAEMGTIPQTTALLPNYPNPFNPETWIPYHLATDAAVILTIYDVRGSVVRELSLGHQPAGVYESRGRAAYWDGRNHLGEKVASGLYFYTLTAGEFTATRKLLITK